MADLPATALRLTKGSDNPPGIRNVQPIGDRVIEHRPNGLQRSVPRGKFVKQFVGSAMELCTNATPEYSADPDAMRDVHDKVMDKRFRLGKRGRASPYDVAKMLASSDHRGLAKLDSDGLEFSRACQVEVDCALDQFPNV